MPPLPRLLRLFAALAALALPAAAQRISLPTANDALYRGDGEAFYQYVNRNFKGVESTPWEGGQYGFSRNPTESAIGLINTKFHEGVDIKPLRRSPTGEPLDDVLATAAGRVVHASAEARHSDYGRYVVIEHRWGGSPYYSLYAHLSEVAVQPGQSVTQGQRIARMGYTGNGINKERAHVHFELNLMLTQQFESWYLAGRPTEPNYHGLYNGLNLAGFDVAKFLLAQRRNPALTVPEFLAGEEVYFRVLAPARAGTPDMLKMYPWMGSAGLGRPNSWEISFTRSGVPLRIQRSDAVVAAPTVSWVKSSPVPYWMMTRRYVFGAGNKPTLSPWGRRLVELILALPSEGASPLMPGDRKQDG